MSNVIRQLWNDDKGAIISVELVLVLGILIFGIIPGLVALRNSVNAVLGTIGNVLTNIVPSFTFSGFAITSASGGSTIAVVQGFATTTTPVTAYTDIQVQPLSLTYITLPPAP